jgi:hypothetical protein
MISLMSVAPRGWSMKDAMACALLKSRSAPDAY